MQKETVKVQPKKDQRFVLYSIPCEKSFVVSPDKTESFLNVKPNPEIRQQQKEMAETIRKNILVEEGPVLKKVRKPNSGEIIRK